MLINFSEINVKNIDGNEIQDFNLILSNTIYNVTDTYTNIDISININKGIDIELTNDKLLELKTLFNNSDLIPYYKKVVSDFIDTKLL